MKSYTDFEQSKKLAEILPPESADMCYPKDAFAFSYDEEPVCHYSGIGLAHPCWSLAALFKLMPNVGVCSPVLVKCLLENKYYCQYVGMGTCKEIHTTSFYDEIVDACVEMIEKLHELKML